MLQDEVSISNEGMLDSFDETNDHGVFRDQSVIEWIQPPRYLNWKDFDQDPFVFTEIVMRITEDDMCTMTFMVNQKRKFYTHHRNRRVWTGPHIDVTLLDIGRVPVGSVWKLGQVNRVCERRSSRFLAQRSIPGAFMLTDKSQIIFSAFTWFAC